MSKKLTEELLNELLFTPSLNEFIENSLPPQPLSLPQYLAELLIEKQLKKSEVIKKSRLTPTFAYHLFAGDRRGSKDSLLQLAFAMGLDLRQTQRLLKTGGAGELYTRSKRDSIIIYAIVNGFSLEETDDTLSQFQENTILSEG